ncbi:MAG: transcription antitermination factor NusB [Sphingobacteriaceae bacterium]
MLNRRQLRVKVLQVLYAYQQADNKEVKLFEKALLKDINSVSEMYFYALSLLIKVADYSLIDAEDRANKHLPSAEDLNAPTKLSDNLFIEALRNHPKYVEGLKQFKVSWDFEPIIDKTIFSFLKNAEEYTDYLKAKEHTIHSDKEIIKYIFRKIILKNPAIEQIFEEKFINWPVDKEVLKAMMAKTFKGFNGPDAGSNQLAFLLQNEKEDREFVIDLLNKSIAHADEYLGYIDKKTKNWDAERIALMDILLMQMAIAELVHFSSIPVKVTINEYLEIAKEFSTPKSNSFINGILDKILADLKAEKKIQKFGRGLIE